MIRGRKRVSALVFTSDEQRKAVMAKLSGKATRRRSRRPKPRPSMTVKQLLDEANRGYPDGFLREYYDARGRFKEGSGDSLARFIVIELSECFGGGKNPTEERETAIRNMERAREEINSVIGQLEKGL